MLDDEYEWAFAVIGPPTAAPSTGTPAHAARSSRQVFVVTGGVSGNVVVAGVGVGVMG